MRLTEIPELHAGTCSDGIAPVRRRGFLVNNRAFLPLSSSDAIDRDMRWALIALLFALASPATAAQALVPLYDSVGLNIGLNCRWQQSCIAGQQRAMKRALTYVKVRQPPNWRVHLCNRNASRGRNRVDWVGFDNCIRNTSLRAPPRPFKRRRIS